MHSNHPAVLLLLLSIPSSAAAQIAGRSPAAGHEGAPAHPSGRAAAIAELARSPGAVIRLESRHGEVVLRSSDDADDTTWEGLLQAVRRGSRAAVAYSVQVDLSAAGGPRTVYVRVIDFVAAAPECAGGASDPMEFYRCAFRNCFSRAGRCAGARPPAACLARRCRDALLACLDRISPLGGDRSSCPAAPEPDASD